MGRISAELVVIAVAIAVPLISLLAVYGVVSTIRELERDRDQDREPVIR